MMWTGWSRFIIWHNCIKVAVFADNWIKICSLSYIGTYNRHVKFGLKIPNCLWNNVRKPRGGGIFWLTLYVCWCVVCRSAVVQWRHWTNARCSAKLLLALLLGFRCTASYSGWWRSIVVRPPVLAGELSLSCARLTAGRVTTLWVKRPLSVNQHGQLSQASLRGRLNE